MTSVLPECDQLDVTSNAYRVEYVSRSLTPQPQCGVPCCHAVIEPLVHLRLPYCQLHYRHLVGGTVRSCQVCVMMLSVTTDDRMQMCYFPLWSRLRSLDAERADHWQSTKLPYIIERYMKHHPFASQKLIIQ